MFRKAAMDKATSPEQLDLVMQVTSPMGWLAVGTIGTILFAIGIWSFVANIPDLDEGQGVLIRGERLTEIKAPSPGTLVSLNVTADANVTEGQVVAVIRRDRSEIEQKIQLKTEQLNRLKAQNVGENSTDQVTAARNAALIAAKASEINSLRSQRATQVDLVKRGLKAESALFEFDRRITGAQGELNALEKENDLVRTRMAPRANQERDLEAELTFMRGDLERTTVEIKSTAAGRVVEVIKSANDKVGEGEPLVRLENAKATDPNAPKGYCGGNIHAVVYVPGDSAGKLRANQPARISPIDVKKEEYGFIVGNVEWVSTHAASSDDMKEKLKNDKLVSSYMEKGPVFEARVCLTFDPKNKVNGLKWSSSQGPPRQISSGGLATSSMVVDQKKPYTYVIPSIKKTLGI
jgi:HlyD family secretion protein